MSVRNFVFKTFMKLTSKTVPYGYEDNFVSDVLGSLFPDDIKKDKHGNYFYKIGESRTIFTSHIDTVSKNYTNVVRKIEGDIIRTDGKTNLGADDKAGMTIMLWMIKNRIPGLYYFFIGEEVGCVGSGLVSGDKNNNINEYDRVISFDRRGTDSVITFQSSGRCCSDKFADELTRQLNKSNMSYKKDTGGVYTDSAEFMHLVSECTNISVGYYKEHTVNEHQDIKHLEKLAMACIKVDWEKLPVERNPKKQELNYWDEWDDNLSHNYSHHVRKVRKRKKRSNQKKYEDRKVYFDGGQTLYEIANNVIESESDDYSWVLNKLLDKNFTKNELKTIKLNYLNSVKIIA